VLGTVGALVLGAGVAEAILGSRHEWPAEKHTQHPQLNAQE